MRQVKTQQYKVIFFCHYLCCFGENDCQNAHLKLRYPPYFVMCFVYCCWCFLFLLRMLNFELCHCRVTRIFAIICPIYIAC